MKTSGQLKDEALNALQGKWDKAVVLTFIFFIIYYGVYALAYGLGWVSGGGENNSSVWGEFLSTLCSIAMIPLSWGLTVAFLSLYRNTGGYKIENLFDGFKNGFSKIVLTYLLMFVYVFLWSLLLVIPGIIKAFSYSMTGFVLKDNPELKYNGAIERSMKLMKGHKMQLFITYLSFIGWALLSVLTCGIGFLWLVPYVQTTFSAFYQELLKEESAQNASAASQASPAENGKADYSDGEPAELQKGEIPVE